MAKIQKHGHTIDTDWPICFNCKHLVWLIGIGFGLRCSNKHRRDENGEKYWTDQEKMPPTIPGILHTCDWCSLRPVDKTKLKTQKKGDTREYWKLANPDKDQKDQK